MVCEAAAACIDVEVPVHGAKYPKKHAAPGYELGAGGFELAPGEVHPWHKAAMPTHEKMKASATYPVVVSPNPMVKTQVCLC